MQWSGQKNAGFTEGTPWIAVNPNYKEINAEEQIGQADSIYEFYRKLIRLRKEYPVFVDGEFSLLLKEDEQIFAYTREDAASRMLVCANFSDRTVNCPLVNEWTDSRILIHNYEGEPKEQLRPYEAVIYIKRE